MYQKLEGKALAYRAEAVSLGVPYVVSLYGDFFAPFDHEDLSACVLEGEAPLFERFSHVSGVLYSADGGGFRFFYIANPAATHPFDCPTGSF